MQSSILMSFKNALFILLDIPVGSGEPGQEKLHGEGAELLLGGGGEGGNDAKGKGIGEEAELLRPDGAARPGHGQRGWLAGNGPGSSLQGLGRGDVQVPEGRVHCQSKVRHCRSPSLSPFSSSALIPLSLSLPLL